MNTEVQFEGVGFDAAALLIAMSSPFERRIVMEFQAIDEGDALGTLLANAKRATPGSNMRALFCAFAAQLIDESGAALPSN